MFQLRLGDDSDEYVTPSSPVKKLLLEHIFRV
jgi:hypothetical protein